MVGEEGREGGGKEGRREGEGLGRKEEGRAGEEGREGREGGGEGGRVGNMVNEYLVILKCFDSNQFIVYCHPQWNHNGTTMEPQFPTSY